MPPDIFQMIEDAEMDRCINCRRLLVVNPGAVGDCVLSLPLISFIREILGAGKVHLAANTEYTAFYPGRTCVDAVRSIENLQMHRLFVKHEDFEIDDKDPLLQNFSGYEWIVSLMGQKDSSFESNLIYTVNCSNPAEVVLLSPKPAAQYERHVSEFLIEQFLSEYGISKDFSKELCGRPLFSPLASDAKAGAQILSELDIKCGENIIAIHPGSGGSEKCWHLDNFIALAEKLSENGFSPVFILGPAELERLKKDLTERMTAKFPCLMNASLLEVFQVLVNCRAFAGNDSGVAHIAASTGLNTFVLFGPSDERHYRPVGSDVHILRPAARSFSLYDPKQVQQVAQSITPVEG